MKKASCLRMADGGELIARWANATKMMHGGDMPNVMFAHGGEIPKAPPPQPKPQTPIPDWMRYALRDGGTVPGKGEGDKIPALYEPGEFVVSNDMIERNPGLREHLHSLRDETLQAQGKDPEQVDAQQAKGKVLRAAFGADGSWDGKFAPEFEKKYAANPQPVSGAEAPGKYKMPAAQPAQRFENMKKPPLGMRAFGHPLVQAAAIGGAMVGDDIYSNLSDNAKDTIGGTINAGLRMFGGGVNDDAMNTVAAQGRGLTAAVPTKPSAATAFATPDANARTLRQGQPVPGQTSNLGREEGVVYRDGNSFSGTNVSNYGNQQTIPGMDPAALDKALTNPNGTRWTARDNAIMAANMAAGNNPYMGTSAAQEAPLSPIQQALRDNPVGTLGRQSALKAAAEMENSQNTRRGQDIQLAGQQLSSRTARMQAQIEQMNKDRQFGLDVAKFGQEKAKTNFEIRQKAQKDKTDEIASYLPPGPDGKPDLAAAAQHMGALQAHMAQRMDGLRKHLQMNPDDRNAAAELEGLETNGLERLGPTATRKFLAGMGVEAVARDTATGSFNPFGTKMVDSDKPIRSLRREEKLIGADYVSDRGDVIPARYIDKTDSTLGIGGRTSNRYQDLIVDDKKKLRE
jgi:hypothetical protein